jgi:hypothetical protein
MAEGKELEVKTIYTASDAWVGTKWARDGGGPGTEPVCEGYSETQPDVISDVKARMA